VSDARAGGRSALVLGATGLVGSACVDLLLADASYERLRVLTRRPYPLSHAKLEAHVVDFDRLGERPELFRAHDIFCCLGTTIRAAGSQAAFRRVDLDYVVTAARTAVEAGAQQLLVVSALGADPGSRIFYNRVKGEMERAVRALPFRAVWVLRPSLLLGERAEPRPGERIAEAVSRPLRPLLLGPLRRWRPMDARRVALAMLRRAESGGGGGVVESDEIETLASGPHPGPHPAR
jgi:uncharacterized protein YbjT (DUF2867 family)